MKKILLVVLALTFAGTAWAGGCPGCGVSGYMAPNLKMYDKGEDNASNLGFGMYYNRFVFSGKMECGEVVKKLAFRVETDIAAPSVHALQWLYVQPYFSDNFSVRMGRLKMPFSRETLHSTAKLLTTSRHYSGTLSAMGYGGYTYGMEAHVAQEKFKLQAGFYDGKGAQEDVKTQDPCISMGARAIFMPMEGFEIGGNVMLVSLPEGGSDRAAYVDPADTTGATVVPAGTYPDTDAAPFLTNSGMAFGIDAEYKKAMGEGSIWLEAEFNMGDNPGAIDGFEAGDEWDEHSFFKWQYMYLRALYMINQQFGIHFGYSIYDPCTDSDDDGENLMTPGITYVWCKNFWTKAEVQVHGYEAEGIDSLTHFVVQSVLLW